MKILRKCLICNKPTENKKYCSSKCSSIGNYRRVEKVCKNCKKVFIVLFCQKHRKFCSQQCSIDFKKSIEEKICLFCGKEFKGYKTRKYCSYQCSVEVSRTKKVCLVCKKVFIISLRNSYRKFCSRECVAKYNRRNRIKKVCLICKKEFEVALNNRDQKYCSKKCINDFYKKRRIKKICSFCKKEFDVLPKFKTQKYCSRECFKKFNEKRKSLSKIKKTCVICKKEFEVALYDKYQKFCSYQCEMEFNKRNRIKKICITCGKEFKVEPWEGSREYCSRKCYKTNSHKKELHPCIICSKPTKNFKYCSMKCTFIGKKNFHPTLETKLKRSHSMKKKYASGELIPAVLGEKRNEIIKKIRLGVIRSIKERKGQIHPNYNRAACEFFEKLNKELNIHIQHAENGGEFHIKELGYWVDGYDPNLNLVIEYDENDWWHREKKYIEKDRIRQEEIVEHLGCSFMRIKEGEEDINIVKNLVGVFVEK